MRNNLFYCYCENPFRTLWKARKVFKMPKIHITFCDEKNCYYYARILDVNIMDVEWKLKYRYASFEYPPKIRIVLFGRWSMYITLNYPIEYSNCVWETILDYVYMDKTIDQSIRSNTWENMITKENINAIKFLK